MMWLQLKNGWVNLMTTITIEPLGEREYRATFPGNKIVVFTLDDEGSTYLARKLRFKSFKAVSDVRSKNEQIMKMTGEE